MASARENSTRAQPSLDFEASGSKVRRPLSWRLVGSEILRFVPLMALLALLAQIGIRGLRPALAERNALRLKDAQLQEQYSAAVEEQEQLELRLRAQGDPIYLERMRRLRLKEQVGPGVRPESSASEQ